MKKIFASNKKAYHDYFIEEKLECGIELKGTEVKSIVNGKVSIKEAWVSVDGGELILHKMHVSPYEQGSYNNQDPLRKRRLLVHKKEIRELAQSVKQNGMTLIPLSIYKMDSYIKVELGICKGKKNYDKRQALKEKDAKRDIARAYKQ